MYIFITSKHVDSDNLCIYGFLVAIFEMLAKENDKKPKFGFSIIQLLFATNLQYLHLNVYLFTSKCILLRVINLKLLDTKMVLFSKGLKNQDC